MLAAAAAPMILRGQRAQRPPNLVFLLTDDQRWDTLGCMGNRIIQTPNVDALARQGATFTNMFVTTPICVTSRASFFSGLYARSHGIHTFRMRFSPAQFAATYPALLRKAGYRTGFVGKYGLDEPPEPKDQFDDWYGFLGQGHFFPKGEPGPHLTHIMGEQAREIIGRQSPGQPFCLSVSYKSPHVQDQDPRQFLADPRDEHLYRDTRMTVPKTMDSRAIERLPIEVQGSEARRRWAVRFSTPELYQRSVRNYYRMITGVDRTVGEIVAALEKQGLRENTIIVYTSDNGFYLGEHGLAGKWFMHEESLRVPLVIHDPRPGAVRGARFDGMALNIDCAPTLLELAGLNPPPAMQGRSLAPWVRGERPAWRKEFFGEHLFEHDWIPKSEGIRTDRWKYARYLNIAGNPEEMYDLSADPHEENNLAPQPAQRGQLEALRRRREAWLAALAGWKPDQPWREPSA